MNNSKQFTATAHGKRNLRTKVKKYLDIVNSKVGESAALGHFSVSILFGQVENNELKNKYSSIAV